VFFFLDRHFFLTYAIKYALYLIFFLTYALKYAPISSDWGLFFLTSDLRYACQHRFKCSVCLPFHDDPIHAPLDDLQVADQLQTFVLFPSSSGQGQTFAPLVPALADHVHLDMTMVNFLTNR